MKYDVVVIGGGPGGYNAAFRAADLGKKVALIDQRDALGGVCLNVGCIPSKSLLHLVEEVHAFRHLQKIGLVKGGELNADVKILHKYRDKVIRGLTQGLKGLAKKRRVDVLQTSAIFNSAQQLQLGDSTTLDFDHCIIAVGSRPVKIPGIPYEDERIIDSTGALELKELPQKMLIIGGGIIGLEMAQVYRALGSEITIVEMLDHIVPPADVDVVKPLHQKLSKECSIYLSTKVKEVKAEKEGLTAFFEGEKAPTSAQYDLVLVAVGRCPNSDLLDIEKAGVELDARGFISVNSQMRTNIDSIFAIGDVVGQPMLAHKASHEAKVAAEVICGHKQAFTPLTIPSVAYTQPELAWAGLTENEAKAQNIPYDKAVFPWLASGRARSMQAEDGFTKLLFHKENKRLIGAAVVGAHAGELISEAVLAIEMGCNAVDLGSSVHPHPTLGETVALAAEVADGSITEM